MQARKKYGIIVNLDEAMLHLVFVQIMWKQEQYNKHKWHGINVISFELCWYVNNFNISTLPYLSQKPVFNVTPNYRWPYCYRGYIILKTASPNHLVFSFACMFYQLKTFTLLFEMSSYDFFFK